MIKVSVFSIISICNLNNGQFEHISEHNKYSLLFSSGVLNRNLMYQIEMFLNMKDNASS